MSPADSPFKTSWSIGYTGRRIRNYLRRRGIRLPIPRLSNELRRGPFNHEIYRQRNLVERAINRLKQFRRIATRYEKLGVNYTAINLSSNQLSSLPPEIGQLTNLSELDLNNNPLTMLPPEIGQLTKLEELKLSNSRLETLPVEIWKLTNLTVLDLRDGRIKILPDGIEQLFELSKLNLRNNLLDTLPKEIWQLTKLKRLDLRGNKLPIPPEILGVADLRRNPGDPSTILNYFFQLQKEQKKPLNEAKMLLVGQGSVGKTSVVKRLIDNCYNPHERKTEGINITNWQITVNEQLIRLNVWDFGGQEIMHATHQFFLTKRSLYLLVLDSRVDELQNKLEYWLKIIHSFSNDSPILIAKIEQAFEAKDIKIIRDINAIGYKERFKEFMQRLICGRCVILVISDQYFKSENCMYELVEIYKNGNLYQRIFTIILADANIFNPIEKIKYIEYWQEKIKELNAALKRVDADNLQGFREDIDQYREIRSTIAKLTDLLRDINAQTEDIHSESEFERLVNAIAQRLDE